MTEPGGVWMRVTFLYDPNGTTKALLNVTTREVKFTAPNSSMTGFVEVACSPRSSTGLTLSGWRCEIYTAGSGEERSYYLRVL